MLNWSASFYLGVLDYRSKEAFSLSLSQQGLVRRPSEDIHECFLEVRVLIVIGKCPSFKGDKCCFGAPDWREFFPQISSCHLTKLPAIEFTCLLLVVWPSPSLLAACFACNNNFPFGTMTMAVVAVCWGSRRQVSLTAINEISRTNIDRYGLPGWRYRSGRRRLIWRRQRSMCT